MLQLWRYGRNLWVLVWAGRYLIVPNNPAFAATTAIGWQELPVDTIMDRMKEVLP